MWWCGLDASVQLKTLGSAHYRLLTFDIQLLVDDVMTGRPRLPLNGYYFPELAFKSSPIYMIMLLELLEVSLNKKYKLERRWVHTKSYQEIQRGSSSHVQALPFNINYRRISGNLLDSAREREKLMAQFPYFSEDISSVYTRNVNDTKYLRPLHISHLHIEDISIPAEFKTVQSKPNSPPSADITAINKLLRYCTSCNF